MSPSLMQILTNRIVEGHITVEEARDIVLRREYFRQDAIRKLGVLASKQKLSEIEAEAIREALDRNHWLMKRTAVELGISRRSLRDRIVRYGLNAVAAAL